MARRRLSAKATITWPSCWVEALDSQSLVATVFPDVPQAYRLFTESQFALLDKKLDALPIAASPWIRFIRGKRVDLRISENRRVRFTSSMLERLGASHDLQLLGLGTCVEVWTEEKYLIWEERMISESMPDFLHEIIWT